MRAERFHKTTPRSTGRPDAAFLVLLSIFGVASLGAESFDLYEFMPPPGTRQSGSDFIGFVESTPSTFAVYSLYKSVPGSGDPSRDFQDEWSAIASRDRRLTSRPTPRTNDAEGGWRGTLGSAGAHGDQQGPCTVLLAVFTGFGRKASVMVLYNSSTYQAKVDRFLSGIRLAAPTSSAAPPPSSATAPTGHTSTGLPAPAAPWVPWR